jgi:hypothetical protein
MIFFNLTIKLVATAFSSLVSKSVVGFLVEPQNQGGGGFTGLVLKNRQLQFDDLGLKITVTVSSFEPQN